MLDSAQTDSAQAESAQAEDGREHLTARGAGFEPTRRALRIFAAGFVFSALPALWHETLWWPWLAFCGAFALCFAVDLWRLAPAHRLRPDLEVPKSLGIGTVGELVCALHPYSGRSVAGAAPASRVRMTADLSPPLWPSEIARGVAGEGGEIRLALELRPERRGTALLEEVWLRYSGPLGLVERQVRLECRREIEIVPDLDFVHSEALRLFGTQENRAGSKIERYTGDGTEFDSLREFVTGDDPRKVDWKASARHTRLLARDMRAERNHQIVMAFDTGRLMAEPVDGAPLLDHAIHAGLLLARVSLRHGDRVGLYSFADRPGLYSAARSGLPAFENLRRLTGSLAYSPAESNFTLALTELGLRLRRRSLVVVLTDFVDSVTGELMVENLLRLARRHLLIFVAFHDPLLLAETERRPIRLQDLDRATVAESMVMEREVVLQRLRRAGLTVIDAAPRQVGARLVNRYLAIKRRERI